MEAAKRIPNIVVNHANLHPLKYEQHWRENISDILQGMRRLLPKVDMDVAEAEYTELLRCEHLLKDLYPSKVCHYSQNIGICTFITLFSNTSSRA
jgi:hypothetical protein